VSGDSASLRPLISAHFYLSKHQATALSHITHIKGFFSALIARAHHAINRPLSFSHHFLHYNTPPLVRLPSQHEHAPFSPLTSFGLVSIFSTLVGLHEYHHDISQGTISRAKSPILTASYKAYHSLFFLLMHALGLQRCSHT
jgi:hypothetical protein